MTGIGTPGGTPSDGDQDRDPPERDSDREGNGLTGNDDAQGFGRALDDAEAGDEAWRPKVDWQQGPVLPPAGAINDLDDADEPYLVRPVDDEPTQLPLGDDEVRLPWLEAGDDDDVAASGSGGQMLGFVLLGLLALGLIVGAIWWATRQNAQEAQVADGSLIEAPDAPYKERPQDPGGKTFAGTGDTSFAVSEGKNGNARLDASGAAQPGFATVPSGAALPAGAAPGAAIVPKPAASGAARAAAAGPVDAGAAVGVGVQVGAFSTEATAKAGWTKLQQQYPALSGLRHRVVAGKADIGTVYRLQAVTTDAAAARALCGQLRTAGLPCQVKD